MRKDAGDVTMYGALSCHIWQCTTRARKLSESDEKCEHYVITSFRKRVPELTPSYNGAFITTATPVFTGRELVNSALSTIAGKFHENLEKFRGENIRAHLHDMYFTESRRISQFSLLTDVVGYTSWAYLGVWDITFGGKIPRIVQPYSMPADGLCVFLEAGSLKKEAGEGLEPWHSHGIVVYATLTEGVMKSMLKDPELHKYRK